MIIEPIKKYLDELPSDRKAGDGLRASSAGKCARAIAYGLHGFEGTSVNWRGQLVFKMGYHVENDLVEVAKNLGLTDMQKECSLTISGVVVKGHIDGIWNGDTVVDFKSTTTFGFKRAAKGDPSGYDRQLHFYMKALGLKRAMLVWYCKDTSALCELMVNWDDAIWAEVEARLASVIASTKDSLPGREYGPNDKGVLPWNCSYCSYCKTCWPGYTLSFSDDGKPILTVNKEE